MCRYSSTSVEPGLQPLPLYRPPSLVPVDKHSSVHMNMNLSRMDSRIFFDFAPTEAPFLSPHLRPFPVEDRSSKLNFCANSRAHCM